MVQFQLFLFCVLVDDQHTLLYMPNKQSNTRAILANHVTPSASEIP